MAQIEVSKAELVWQGKYNEDGSRKKRRLPLASDPHTYEKSGRYRILVKVIDMFGNDTSQAFNVEDR
jgi:adenine-specific DNA-methyltransferase